MGVSTLEAPCSYWKHQGRLSKEMRPLLPSWLHLSSEELSKYLVLIFVTICCIFGRRQRRHLYPMQLVVNNKTQLKLHLTYRDKQKYWQTASATHCFMGLKSTDITDFRHSLIVTLALALFVCHCSSSLPHVSVILSQVSFILAKWQSQFQASQGHTTLSRTKGCSDLAVSAKIMRFFLIGPAQATCPSLQNRSLQLGEWNVMVGLAQVTCSPLETSQNMKPLIEFGDYWKGEWGGVIDAGGSICVRMSINCE